MKKQKIIVAVTGASGAIYARALLEKLVTLKEQVECVAVVFSAHARQVWEHELGAPPLLLQEHRNFFYEYTPSDFMAPFASGSSDFRIMIICPCSMGTLGRIASGISGDLISRAADVMLKERRKLILVTRDTPLHLIHLTNMQLITQAGGIICPACPSFYSHPKDFLQLAYTVIDRVLDICGLDIPMYRWGQ